jgi:hemerythrin
LSLLAWSNMFSVGVKDIDDQHKKLVELANALNDAMKAGKGKETLGNILSELVTYTVTHFAFEERLMEKHKYPMSPQHRQEHKDLVKTVGEFKTKFEQGDAALTSEVMTFLRDWLTKHIMNSDKMFGKDLNSKGVR